MASKDEVFSNYRRQTGKRTQGSTGRDGQYNLLYHGRTLYSFGTHFPLAIRYHSGAEIPEGSEGFGCGVQYIVNGDKYSATTTQHQNQAIKSLKPNVQIPFSALENAWNWGLQETMYYKEWGQWYSFEEACEIERKAQGVGPDAFVQIYSAGWGSTTNRDWVNRANALAEKLRDGSGGFKIVAYRKDTWQHTHDGGKTWAPGYFSSGNFVDTGEPYDAGIVCCGEADCDWVGPYPRTGEQPISTHRLGAVLFTIRGNTFLSSFDELDRTNYFLCQVPGSPTTIEEAYEALVPDVVKALPSREGVLRQGDWFFIPVSEDKDTLRSIRKAAPYVTNTNTSAYRLGEATGTHVVTRARRTADGLLVVQGCVRHSPADGRRPEHKRLKLGDGKQWYVPVKNTSEAGWGARGNVD